MTSTQDKYSALKSKYTKLMASYRKISDLLADKNKEIIGGAEGTGDNNNLQQYVIQEYADLQELIWDYRDNLPYVENLFQIIDYICIKFALYEIYESGDKKYISKHFESDFDNWKTKKNADFLNDCVFFLMKNIEAYKDYFYYIYFAKYSKNQLLVHNRPGSVLINILEYFGPICSNDDSEKNNSMGIDKIAKIYGFRIVDAGGGGGDGKSFFHSIIYQLSGMKSVTDKSNNHLQLRNELYKYISVNNYGIFNKYGNNDKEKISKIIENGKWGHDSLLISAICDIIGKEIVIYEKRKTNNSDEYKIIRTVGYERLLSKEKFTDKIYLLYHTDSLHYQSLVPMDKEVASIDQKKNDPYNLQHFIDKQKKYFEIALDEIKNGETTTQWMWFVAPSSFNIEVARAYLNQKSLRDNLKLILEKINEKLNQNNYYNNYAIISKLVNKYDLFFFPDSLRLFECASRENIDDEVNTLCKELLNKVLEDTNYDCDKFKKTDTAPEYFKIAYG